MDQEIRNKLRNVVTQCRKLLEDSISQELEGKYGIFAKKEQVTADPHAKMNHLSDEEQAARKDILDHFAHIKARGFGAKDALDQLIREIAFTHLNRLCAYKMMEAREVYVGGQKFREAVSRGVNSNGVKFYLAEHPEEERLFNTGQQDVAYRHFLDWLGGALSEEIGVLFNPNDPANRLYPRQKTLEEVLDLLNGGGIKAEETELRDQWPLIWSQDETIGWVYQYFTPKELRDQARKESQAPRNSYELAFRNQFYTPRYVVEFLTDNTLGRIWYEMRKGETRLKDQCRYMVRRPTEIFLKEGEQSPKDAAEGKDDLSQEELLKLPVHIPHRPKKDPRELKILDPACGSGHFLLYCFDLLLTIYEEAYADPDIGPALKKDYSTLDALKRDVPRLILAHNLHGIDIDLRASQIAALALWLRCQRAYQEMGLKKDRPQITRSNFVCAEPMPGEEQMLKEFVSQLEPKVLGQVVGVVFDKMKLAGEAGSLLKIEEEIRDAVAAAKKQYVRETTQATDRKGRTLLFTEAEMERLDGKPIQPSLFDLSDITDNQFFEQAESRVIDTLRSYAEKAQTGQRLQRQLFTDDAVRGFAFVDICHKRYDIVLMNPPFGDTTTTLIDYFENTYSLWNKNLLCAFMARAYGLCRGGFFGCVYDRTANIKNTYEEFRRHYFLGTGRMQCVADLGWNVLDANVEVSAATVLSPTETSSSDDALDVSGYELTHVDVSSKANELLRMIHKSNGVRVSRRALQRLPNSVIGYYFPSFLINMFTRLSGLEACGAKVFNGHTIKSDEFFRYSWELPTGPNTGFSGCWARLYNGGSYSRYYLPSFDAVYYGTSGKAIASHPSTIFRNLTLQQKPGVAFGKRGDFIDAHLLREGFVSTVEGQAVSLASLDDAFVVLALLNSRVFQYVINQYCGQHKYPGYVNLFPSPAFDLTEMQRAGQHAREITYLKEQAFTFDETSALFLSGMSRTHGESPFALIDFERQLQSKVAGFEDRLNRALYSAFGLQQDSVDVIEGYCRNEPPDSLCFSETAREDSERLSVSHSLLSYSLGCILGRWDIRYATGERQAPTLPDPFGPLPVCSPGMLQGNDGLPLAEAPPGYPFNTNKDGVLVDDPESTSDIVRRVREVFELIWNGHAEVIEKEACEILGVKELRDYFRKPGKGGFWDDHISRYSKSRRKAPIYWLLQSSKKNYAIWLYYHRFDKDMIFKMLVNYVEPKIRLETIRLETLRSQIATAGDSGKEAKRIAKETEKQEDFFSELRDFEDKLRRAANLNLVPDLNDGVVLNIAPLHELVPWKEAKKYWDELMQGQYEWSSIGKQLREKGLVK